MPSYHFSLGNSTDGPVGFCARVTANSKEEALEMLKRFLPNVFECDNPYVCLPAEGDYITVYFNQDAITVDDIDEVQDEPPVCVECEHAPEFTFAQVEFVANKILAGAIDRIEGLLPPNVPLSEYQENKTHIHWAIVHIKDTTAMTVAIFLAQTTGQGYGAYDWDGAYDFDDLVDNLINERVAPDYKNYTPGAKCSPDCAPISRKIAKEWECNS
jgi:hypothetical protein